MQRSRRSSLAMLAGRLPRACVAFYIRLASGERDLIYLTGDVTGATGHRADALARPRGWLDVLHPDDRTRVVQALVELEPGEERTLDYRILTPDGGERWVRDTMVYAEGGIRDEIVGIVRDVSVERSLRDQVAALEARIWEAQRMESLGGVASGVAHDFNNILATILTASELIDADGNLSDSRREDLTLIKDAAQRGSRMVRQILRFAARRPYEAGTCDLGRITDDLRLILERRLGPSVDLRIRRDETLPPVIGDPAQLEQVVLNLAINAREAMDYGGVLDIEVRAVTLDHTLAVWGSVLEPGAYVRLSVCDEGRGMPEDVRERIFEPFFTTKGGTGGAGLGLSTVQRIVRGHGGAVAVASEPGRGTTIYVYFPAPAMRSAAPPEVAAASMSPPTTGGRVLVVEDEAPVRDLLVRVMTRQGHAVLAVGTAAEALRAFDRSRPPFDAVLVDVLLPDRPGTDLVRALRRRREDLPVIFMSGFGHEAIGHGSVTEGTSFLPKPFTAVELQEALDRALTPRVEVRGTEGTGSL